MPMPLLTREHLAALAPRARSTYLAAFERAGEVLPVHGISSPLRLAHFLAQVLHETDGLTIRVESLNYTGRRLMQVWPTRFRNLAGANRFAHAPEHLAEHVYGGRMGNGPEGSGDGWRFVGRGLLQITGRSAYERYGRALGIDLAGNPDLAFSADWSLAIAAAEWAASRHDGRSCNALADADDLDGVTRAINGGLIGLADRRKRLAAVRRVLAVTAPD